MEPHLLNGLTLAYIGDSYYELYIRMYLVKKNLTKVDNLHKNAIHYTKGESQAKIINELIEKEFLTEEEISIYKRGRNCKNNQNRKNISIELHNKSSGFEAIIGYLYMLENNQRLNEILEYAVNIVESVVL